MSKQTITKCPCCGMNTLHTWEQRPLISGRQAKIYIQCMNNNCPGSDADEQSRWLEKRKQEGFDIE